MHFAEGVIDRVMLHALPACPNSPLPSPRMPQRHQSIDGSSAQPPVTLACVVCTCSKSDRWVVTEMFTASAILRLVEVSPQHPSANGSFSACDVQAGKLSLNMSMAPLVDSGLRRLGNTSLDQLSFPPQATTRSTYQASTHPAGRYTT